MLDAPIVIGPLIEVAGELFVELAGRGAEGFVFVSVSHGVLLGMWVNDDIKIMADKAVSTLIHRSDPDDGIRRLSMLQKSASDHPPCRERIAVMAKKSDRDIEKNYSTTQMVAKLRRLADCLDQVAMATHTARLRWG
jgi:hypothetical protein